MRAHNFSRKQRRDIRKRANGCCEGCGANLKTGEGEADHILPVEFGGESVIENGQWLCTVCHDEKTAVDIRSMRRAERVGDRHTGVMPPSRHPMPCGRSSRFKKCMDGRVVERRKAKRVHREAAE